MNKRGYIDPGTGGYLVTSIWPTVLTFLAIMFSAIGAFLVKYFITPIKKFFRKRKNLILLIIIILLIANLTVTTILILKQNKGENNKADNLTEGDDYYGVYNDNYNYIATIAGDFIKEGKLTQKDGQGNTLSAFLKNNQTNSNQQRKSGMYIYNKDETYPGYLLIENKLVDESGKIIHSWNPETHMGVIQPDGSYIAQKGNGGKNRTSSLVKYSWNGTLIWENFETKPHHKISLTEENTILTIGKETHEYKGDLVDFDIILEYDQDGNEIYRWSTWDNFDYLQTFHKPLAITNDSIKPGIKSIWGGYYDYYHMNSVEEIPDNTYSWYEEEQDGEIIRPFQQGNIVFNFRHGSMIFILDRNTGKIVWHVTQYDVPGEIQGQHDSTILPSGNMLIYDNGRYRNSTRIIELNPITKEIEWNYTAPGLFTIVMGDANKLPNGNYLLSETVKGRIFEINSEGKLLWEFFHPQTEQKNGMTKRKDIFQVKKYEIDFIEKFLQKD